MRHLSNADLAELLNKEIFHKITEAADSLHLDCYVVGGYVRDLFLERPSNDIDVVVVGSGVEVADRLRQLLGKKAHISVFRNFGTAQVKYHGTEIEFVGVCTGICVISNAMLCKAAFPEANIVIDAALCACVTPESHDTALNAMRLCQMEILHQGEEPWRK